MSDHPPQIRNIPALTGIRALAAILVLSLHIDQNVPTNIKSIFPFISQGYLGVDFFFILSGFIITYVYADNFTSLNWKAVPIFLWHRLIRLYPVHITVLAVMIVMAFVARSTGRPISDASFNSKDLIWQLLLVHAWGVSAEPTWNVPSWSISAEWFAYLLFPFVAPLLFFIRRKSCAYAFSFGAIGLMAVALFLTGSGIGGWVGIPALVRVVGEFLCGAGLCRAVAIETATGTRHWNGDLLGFVAFAGFIIFASAEYSGFVLVGFLALTILGAATAKGPLAKLLGSKMAVWIGEVSYSIYMVHFPILIVLRRIYERLGFSDWNWSARGMALLATYIIVIVVAALVYYLVERPMRVYLRDRMGILSPQPTT
jgi:peptidoglycan/LPS O-acetylase OafA/YrhL